MGCFLLFARHPLLLHASQTIITRYCPFPTLGCLWTAIVAFSRLRMGAHFLTDVTMAWLVTLGLTVLGVYLFYFNKKFFQFVWNLISEREEQSYEQE